MNEDDQSHEQNTSKSLPTTLQNPSLVVNSMLTALAQSLLPSSTNQQQFLADLQAAATLVNKQKLSSTNDNNQHESNSHIKANRTDNQDNLPHTTQAKRRATHNAVERRRRDRINQHIQQLSKLIPDCSSYVKNQSKTVVLEKTIAYLHELRTQNLALVKQTVDAGIILHENDLLRDRIRVVEQENGVLKSLLTKQSLLNGNESSLT
ncbi:unnamed protein product [Rotaria sordida]|uniref:BHLH domain-containing protein n=1 Tax=Rotaria sordida TaxID=392033 RepID=A0A814E8J0_9BILA|nr:unnamed protein product [Rotaria sordida]CAF0977651.1 unnamed protein product [Rotaria sordida]CAF1022977.1 unnamed protein product [Rotaria sordida]CAF3607711.1 unnamed protein product [Rotaria sordida]